MSRFQQRVLGALLALSLVNGGLLIGTAIGPQIRPPFSEEAHTYAGSGTWTRRSRLPAPMRALPTVESRRKQEDPNKASG
jgi:hypothetical protein